jgi:hypothetical protein
MVDLLRRSRFPFLLLLALAARRSGDRERDGGDRR